MDTLAQLQQMRDYVVRTLEATDQFSVIEPGYNFGQASGALREQAQRHIYCELKAGYSPTGQPLKFLVVANTDTMPGPLFAEKLVAASHQDVHTLHLLYRYTNSQRQPETHGPLFRRFLHEEDKVEGARYHIKAAANRRSLEHYDSKRRNNFRHLREIEREWVPATQGSSALYYQPHSDNLSETIKRYEWGNVTLRGINHRHEPYEKISEIIKEPLEKEDLALFTLRPMAKNPPNSLRNLKSISRFIPRHQQILLADIVECRPAVPGPTTWEEEALAQDFFDGRL